MVGIPSDCEGEGTCDKRFLGYVRRIGERGRQVVVAIEGYGGLVESVSFQNGLIHYDISRALADVRNRGGTADSPKTQDVKTAFCSGSKAILPYF